MSGGPTQSGRIVDHHDGSSSISSKHGRPRSWRTTTTAQGGSGSGSPSPSCAAPLDEVDEGRVTGSAFHTIHDARLPGHNPCPHRSQRARSRKPRVSPCGRTRRWPKGIRSPVPRRRRCRASSRGASAAGVRRSPATPRAPSRRRRREHQRGADHPASPAARAAPRRRRAAATSMLPSSPPPTTIVTTPTLVPVAPALSCTAARDRVDPRRQRHKAHPARCRARRRRSTSTRGRSLSAPSSASFAVARERHRARAAALAAIAASGDVIDTVAAGRGPACPSPARRRTRSPGART